MVTHLLTPHPEAALDGINGGSLLQLLLLGPPLVSSNGCWLTEKEGLSRKTKSLLAYLALHVPAHRNTLMAVFWPEATENQANTSLRTAIRRLRSALSGPNELQPILFQSEGYYQINPALGCATDVQAFEEHLGKAEHLSGASVETQLRQAIQLYRGDFMTGYHDPWIDGWQPRLQLRHLRAMETLARLVLEREEIGEARRLADRILLTDPAWEGAHQVHIEIHLRLRDRMSALRQYEQLKASLRQALAVPPSQSSLELYHQITTAF